MLIETYDMMLTLDDIDEALFDLRIADRLLRNGFGEEREMIGEVISRLEERKVWIEARLSAADREDDDYLQREYRKNC